jgi:hypothetical protein
MRRTLRTALAGFWANDRGLSVFLASLVAVVFVLPPLVPMGPAGRFLGDAVFSLMLVSGASAVAQKPWALVVISVIALGALSVRWASWAADLTVWREVSTLATLVPLCIVILMLVVRRGPVTRQRIEGAIAVYVLLGLTWAQAYELVALLDPGAFAGAVGGQTSPSWVYYSFVTLTTMGYGDITPLNPVARSLAILEALTGQLYLAILVARLVSLELHSRRGGPGDGPRGRDQSDA